MSNLTDNIAIRAVAPMTPEMLKDVLPYVSSAERATLEGMFSDSTVHAPVSTDETSTPRQEGFYDRDWAVMSVLLQSTVFDGLTIDPAKIGDAARILTPDWNAPFYYVDGRLWSPVALRKRLSGMAQAKVDSLFSARMPDPAYEAAAVDFASYNGGRLDVFVPADDVAHAALSEACRSGTIESGFLRALVE